MKLATGLAAACAGLLGAVPALAEQPADRYWLTGSGMYSSADTSIRIDSSSGLGTSVSLEKDIGLQGHQAMPVVLGGLRLGEHWRIEAEYLRLWRSGSAIIGRPITIGDTTYNVNSTLSGGLHSDTYRATVGYSFILNDAAELGGSLGFHVTRFGVDFTGTGTVSGGAARVTSEARDVTAPLPTLGIYGSYKLSPMFSLTGRADYLSIKIKNVKGKLVDTQAGVSARVLKNFSLGAGYRYVEYGVTATKTNFRGKLEYKFHGPVVYGELAF